MLIDRWLETVCKMLSGANWGGVYCIQEKLPVLESSWPGFKQQKRTSELLPLAQLASERNSSVINYIETGLSESSGCDIGLGFTDDKGQKYAIIVCFDHLKTDPRQIISLLEWGVAWFRMLPIEDESRPLIVNAEQPSVGVSGAVVQDVEAGKAAHALTDEDKGSGFPGAHFFSGLRRRHVIAGGLFLVCLLAVFPVDYVIKSPATLEGRVQQAITVPFDGYLAAIEVGAGDLLEEGQVVARLDDAELNLQLNQAHNDFSTNEKQHRQALAKLEYSEAKRFAFERDKARIDIQLLEKQLAKLNLKAPVAGVIISGDMSRATGAAVEKGQVLFEMAPQDDYRVVIDIDEKDIRHIASDQLGELVLTGFGGDSMAITVDVVSAIFTQQEGGRFYRCEARLSDSNQFVEERLRPGMQGTAGVVVGEKVLGALLLDPLLSWFKLKLWQWTP